MVMSVMSAFQKGRCPRQDREGCVFARGGVIEQADEKALKRVQPGVPGRDAERKRHGQIPKPNGNAVADTGKKHPAPLGALCAIHRKNLFSARFRYRKIYF